MTRVMSRTLTFLLILVIAGGVRLAGAIPPSLYEIIDLGRGENSSSARLINERGDVVILESYFLPWDLFASISSFLWTETGGRISIPGAGAQILATDLNASGQVVGYTGYPAVYSFDADRYQAFSWTAATGTTVIPPEFACGRTSTYANAVNDAGLLVGSQVWDCGLYGGSGSYSFLWSPETGRRFVGYGIGGGDINDYGQVTGSFAPVFGGSRHAVLWSVGTEPVDLGTLGGENSNAIAINNSGQITGNSDTSTSGRHAFFWSAGTGMLDLGTLGGLQSTAVALSSAGHVVGHNLHADGNSHAFLWTMAGGMIDLGTLGGAWSRATDVSAFGQVVGHSALSDGTSHAFSWTPERGMMDLGALGGANSAALAVNSRGQIVGWSYLTGSELAHATLWQPISVEQLLSNLIADTAAARFQQGASLLRNARSSFNRGNLSAACNQISAFMNQVRAQSGKSLPAVQAGGWLASATQVKAIAGCP